MKNKTYTLIFEYGSGEKETVKIKTHSLDFSVEQYFRNRIPFSKYEIIEEEDFNDEDN